MLEDGTVVIIDDGEVRVSEENAFEAWHKVNCPKTKRAIPLPVCSADGNPYRWPLETIAPFAGKTCREVFADGVMREPPRELVGLAVEGPVEPPVPTYPAFDPARSVREPEPGEVVTPEGAILVGQMEPLSYNAHLLAESLFAQAWAQPVTMFGMSTDGPGRRDPTALARECIAAARAFDAEVRDLVRVGKDAEACPTRHVRVPGEAGCYCGSFSGEKR